MVVVRKVRCPPRLVLSRSKTAWLKLDRDLMSARDRRVQLHPNFVVLHFQRQPR